MRIAQYEKWPGLDAFDFQSASAISIMHFRRTGCVHVSRMTIHI